MNEQTKQLLDKLNELFDEVENRLQRTPGAYHRTIQLDIDNDGSFLYCEDGTLYVGKDGGEPIRTAKITERIKATYFIPTLFELVNDADSRLESELLEQIDFLEQFLANND